MSACRTNFLTLSNQQSILYVLPTIEVKKDDDNNKAEEFNLEIKFLH